MVLASTIFTIYEMYIHIQNKFENNIGLILSLMFSSHISGVCIILLFGYTGCINDIIWMTQLILHVSGAIIYAIFCYLGTTKKIQFGILISVIVVAAILIVGVVLSSKWFWIISIAAIFLVILVTLFTTLIIKIKNMYEREKQVIIKNAMVILLAIGTYDSDPDDPDKQLLDVHLSNLNIEQDIVN
eukprot:199044_1